MEGIIKKIWSHNLARNSAIVFTGTMTANALSYLYHLVMGRLLGPAGYGELSSLISILYIFTVPLIVAQTVLIKFVSALRARKEPGEVKSLFLSATKISLGIIVIGIPLLLVVRPWVTQFLNLSSPTLLLLLYVLLAFSLLSIISAAVLTGYQMFVWMSGLGAFAVLLKLIVSIPFASWRVPGVLLAAVAAAIVTYIAYFFPLRGFLAKKVKPLSFRTKDTLGFAVPALITQVGVTSLFSTDIILVRHFFDAKSAGLYAALAILGKIIFYASAAVPAVLFPVASERAALGEGTKKLVLTAIGAVTVISLGVTAVYFFFPDIIVQLLFGNAYSGAGILLGEFGVFLTLYSIGNIIATSCLATGKMFIWIFAFVSATLQIIGINVFHASIAQVVLLNIAVSALFMSGSLAYYLYEKV